MPKRDGRARNCALPPTPDPPYDIETMEPLSAPPQ